MFAFNEQADRFLLKPLSQGYKFITPDPIERGVTRVFDNVGHVVTVANDLLQGKFSQAANDAGRFLVNTTLGVAGIFDVASEIGLKSNDSEDFGQTLGAWGVKSGPYLVLPLLGASTLRDAPSRVVDGLINPINEIDHVPTRNTVYGAQIISVRASFLDAEKLISGDKYVFTRDVYLQRRSYLVSDGELEDSFGEGYDDGDDYYE
jgi:phospholipid-binding lipoprotein MlaA